MFWTFLMVLTDDWFEVVKKWIVFYFVTQMFLIICVDVFYQNVITVYVLFKKIWLIDTVN